MSPTPGETETGAPPEPSAWLVTTGGGHRYVSQFAERRWSDETAVPLYTLEAAREGYVRESEVTAFRRAMEELFPVSEGFTEAFDDLERMGLLVEVPADELFREEWDADTMYVWAWSDLAKDAKR